MRQYITSVKKELWSKKRAYILCKFPIYITDDLIIANGGQYIYFNSYLFRRDQTYGVNLLVMLFSKSH